ncbi:MAG TPA: energy transducer TonB [Saprospiraceae bacterium]|nr:energy transducer TonB [Saprospiraceae bacterium]
MKRKKNDFIHQPIFPGGLKAMRAFIQEHLVYPKEAFDAKIQGKVFVKYIVNESGDVIDAKVIHGLGYGCDEEAVRVVRKLKFNVKKTRGLKLKHNKSIRIHFNYNQAAQQKIKQTSKPFSQISYTTVKKDSPDSSPPKDKGESYGYEIQF